MRALAFPGSDHLRQLRQLKAFDLKHEHAETHHSTP